MSGSSDIDVLTLTELATIFRRMRHWIVGLPICGVVLVLSHAAFSPAYFQTIARFPQDEQGAVKLNDGKGYNDALADLFEKPAFANQYAHALIDTPYLAAIDGAAGYEKARVYLIDHFSPKHHDVDEAASNFESYLTQQVTGYLRQPANIPRAGFLYMPSFEEAGVFEVVARLDNKDAGTPLALASARALNEVTKTYNQIELKKRKAQWERDLAKAESTYAAAKAQFESTRRTTELVKQNHLRLRLMKLDVELATRELKSGIKETSIPAEQPRHDIAIEHRVFDPLDDELTHSILRRIAHLDEAGQLVGPELDVVLNQFSSICSDLAVSTSESLINYKAFLIAQAALEKRINLTVEASEKAIVGLPLVATSATKVSIKNSNKGNSLLSFDTLRYLIIAVSIGFLVAFGLGIGTEVVQRVRKIIRAELIREKTRA